MENTQDLEIGTMENDLTQEEQDLTAMSVLDKERALRVAKRVNALEKLESNEDWKTLIGEYTKDRVLDLNSLLAVEGQKEVRPAIMEELVAISHFSEFLRLSRLEFNSMFDCSPEEAVSRAEAL